MHRCGQPYYPDLAARGASVPAGTREVIAAVEAAGAAVAGVGVLVDRSGGTAALPAPRAALLTLAVPTYPPEACPLCHQGVLAVKPGSRPTGAAATG